MKNPVHGTPRGDSVALGGLSESGRALVSRLLSNPQVMEVMRNADGTVWVESADKGMHLTNESISEQDAIEILRASMNRWTSGREIPDTRNLIEGVLGEQRARVVGLLPPISTSPVFAIRKHARAMFSLDDYRDMGIVDSLRSNFVADRNTGELAEMSFEHPVDAIKYLVRERKNILIVGPAGSGKTTLANTLLNEIAEQTPGNRLIILEDAAELQTRIPNKVALTTSLDIDMRALLRITMRLRPDRIIIGEIRGWEAYTLLKGWTSGHPGGVATLHASDSQEALSKLSHYIFEEPAAQCFTSESIGWMISQAVDVVMVIGKSNNSAGRRVKEICEVRNYMNGRFNFNILRYQPNTGAYAFKSHM